MARYSLSLLLDASIILSKYSAAQSLINTLLSFSQPNRLPWQQHNLFETLLIAALRAYNSKTTR